jgi:hypothetical protein
VTPQNISELFGRFVGRDVAVRETITTVKIGGEIMDIAEARIAPGRQPVLQELKDEAARHGITTRVMTPGAIVTMDFDPNRLNVYLHRDGDGTYRIGGDMHFDGQRRMQETFESIVKRGVDKDVSVMRPLRLKPAGAPKA